MSRRPETARAEGTSGRFFIGTPFHRELLDPRTLSEEVRGGHWTRLRTGARQAMHAVAHFCAPPVESRESQGGDAGAMTLDLETESAGIGWTEQSLVWGGAVLLLAVAWLTA